MNKKVLFLSVLAILVTGCKNDVDLYQEDLELKDSSTNNYFDFSTTEEVSLDIDLGEWGKSAYVVLYDSNPLADSEESSSNLKEVSLYAGFADASGKLNTTISLPSGLNKVYAYCPSWALPEVTELTVKDGSVRATIAPIAATASKRSVTRSDEQEYTVQKLDNNFYMLCEISNNYGAIKDINGIYDTGDLLTADDLTKIQTFFWKGSTTRPSAPNNSSLVKSSEVTNITISSKYTDENGEMQTVDGVTLWVTMLAEYASYANSFGYYYYKTTDERINETFTSDEALQYKKDMKKFVVFPNASTAGSKPFTSTSKGKAYGLSMTSEENAPLAMNTRVKLLFQKEDGTFTDKFPPGYTIGFFSRVMGWYAQEGWDKNCFMQTGVYNDSIILSNSSLNVDFTPQQRFVGLSMQLSGKEVVVYGLEDSKQTDKSYDDMLYIVEASPEFAVKDDHRISIDVEEQVGVEKTRYFYAFEDIWPDGGDYDLNDVIIRHDRTVTFDNQNIVKTVEDAFTPVQPSGSANYINSFAVQIPSDQRGASIVIPEGATDETATNSVVLFTNTNNDCGKTRTIVRDFTGKKLSKNNLKVDVVTNINPYIIAAYEGNTETSRLEIHLPKASPTKYINKKAYNTTSNSFYIDKDGQFPFAIAIPAESFVPCSEKTPISQEYPDYLKWVKSGGTEYGTWYLNHTEN